METKTVYQNYRKREENVIQAFIKERQNLGKTLKYAAYGLAVFLLVSLTLIQSGQIVFKYFQEPTYISSHYDRQGSAVIPSISICPDLDFEVIIDYYHAQKIVKKPKAIFIILDFTRKFCKSFREMQI